MTSNLKKLKVGDKAWSIQLGDCVVTEIYSEGLYQYVLASFCEKTEKLIQEFSYTRCGKHYHLDKYPSAFAYDFPAWVDAYRQHVMHRRKVAQAEKQQEHAHKYKQN